MAVEDLDLLELARHKASGLVDFGREMIRKTGGQDIKLGPNGRNSVFQTAVPRQRLSDSFN
ncbi:MAG: hypothetical protein O9972_18270, partial [Burkholderiales bacterium]|nr:hypothetical protein [Burkholderiales bacterium]